MAIIRMATQEVHEYVKKNDVKLQVMYDTAPSADEELNTAAKPVAKGFAAFRDYIGNNKKKVVKESCTSIRIYNKWQKTFSQKKL